VYCGSSKGNDPTFEHAARELGEWIAREGHGLVYGGSAIGLMGVVAGAALEGGAYATGVEPRFFLDSPIAQHDLPELIAVDTMAERKAIMIELGDAFIALPGGLGTLEEMSEIMSRIRLRLTSAPCIFLNINGFYDDLKAFLDKLRYAGFVEDYEYGKIQFCPTVADAARAIEAWKPNATPAYWQRA
jgi:uncharacterized protein (TIGR00730 family)